MGARPERRELVAPPPPPPPLPGSGPGQQALGQALEDSVLHSGLLEDPDTWSGDHIATLARSIAQAPVGFLFLVGEQGEVSHSLVASGEPEPDCEALQAFCGGAVLSRRPVLVPDLQGDPRFRGDSLLGRLPAIRSYAGFPVIGPDGLVLGCLGVLHHAVQPLSDERIQALERLALLVVKRLQLQRLARMVEARTRSGGLAAVAPPAGRLLSRDQLLDTVSASQRLGAQVRYALLRCEIREYDRISASFGGRVAAGLIAAATERLLEALPAEALAARFCDAEFLLLLPHASQQAVIESTARRLIRHFADQPFRVEHHTFPITLAIGIATADSEQPTADTLCTEACIARRMASRATGSQYRFLDARTRLRVVEDFTFEEQLRAALENGRFDPFFQPMVRLRRDSHALIGFEVLGRWLNEQGEYVQPAQFLGVSARLGLAGEIDLQVIRKALQACPALARVGLQRPLLLSVNLSAQLLGDVLLRERLLDLIRAEPLPDGWSLQVEIIEEALQDTSPAFDDFLADLADLSVAIAIDDFGIGYSSLGRLHSLPIQAIKIDRSFVQQIDDQVSPSNRLLRTMHDLGRDLGLAITAEGVETPAQCEWLRQLGVENAQGFLFARPMDFDDSLRYLQEQRAALVESGEASAPSPQPGAAASPASEPALPAASGDPSPRSERLVRTVPQRRSVFGRLFRER
jgi:EAL domain-containing protein (putative c-di-GMP-specific phosphodiesterase class I)/GGDEF domain-containing protein